MNETSDRLEQANERAENMPRPRGRPRREGAALVPITLRVEPETLTKFDELCRECNVSRPKMLEKMLEVFR